MVMKFFNNKFGVPYTAFLRYRYVEIGIKLSSTHFTESTVQLVRP